MFKKLINYIFNIRKVQPKLVGISLKENQKSVLNSMISCEIVEDDKEGVLQYMRLGKIICITPGGGIPDILSDIPISAGIRTLYTDGEYYWYDLSIYYYEKYNMYLPHEFIEKARGNCYKLPKKIISDKKLVKNMFYLFKNLPFRGL